MTANCRVVEVVDEADRFGFAYGTLPHHPDRETGQLTVAQFPNWPLFAIGAATVLRWFTGVGTTVNDGAGWSITALWLFWGGDELVRGVNPWRRLLGAGVVGWQILRLVAR